MTVADGVSFVAGPGAACMHPPAEGQHKTAAGRHARRGIACAPGTLVPVPVLVAAWCTCCQPGTTMDAWTLLCTLTQA